MNAQKRRLQHRLQGRFGCHYFGHDGSQHNNDGYKTSRIQAAPLPEDRLLQFGTEERVLLEEETNHSDEQQRIAGIGDADAPRVVVIGEDDSQSVTVVIRLAETPSMVFEGLVHPHLAFVHLHSFPFRMAAPVQQPQL